MKASMQHQEVTYELQPLQKLKEQLNSLDHVVTEHEIRQAVKTLKKKKSPFVDGIRNEMIEASLESLMPVLQSGKMPDSWCQGVIAQIYKSGDKSDPTNCRGICISSRLRWKIALLHFKSKAILLF